MSELDHVSAIELAGLIRQGQFSAIEVVEHFIKRIEALRTSLGAVVTTRYDAARVEAQAADARLKRGRTVPPLLGVPFTVKEMLGLAGYRSTMGCYHRRSHVATQDATVVARLRAAGAIVVGLTNQSEAALWLESSNPVYGRTGNPHDPSRSPGGSSGGEAAVIASGGSMFGVGSDGGGSIRIPSAYCGVFGHKPTASIVPLSGHYPVVPGPGGTPDAHMGQYVCLGPITRSATDLMPLLRVMAGPDGFDPRTVEVSLGEPDTVDWAGREVFVLEDPGVRFASRVSTEVCDAVRQAADVLSNRGARVSAYRGPALAQGADLWLTLFGGPDAESLNDVLGGGAPVQIFREAARLIAGRGRHSLAGLLLCLGERIPPRPDAARFDKAMAVAERLRTGLREVLGGGGVLLMPVQPTTAPYHHVPLLRPTDFAYTSIFNILGNPGTSAPMGKARGGLPLSVQIVGDRGADAIPISAAMVLEEEVGGWVEPERLG